MNTYSVEFTIPLIRDNNLKTRTERVEAESCQAAEAIVMARHQGVRIVDTLCHMTAIMDPVAVAAHDLAHDLEVAKDELAHERADNAELRTIIEDLKRQVTLARHQRDQAQERLTGVTTDYLTNRRVRHEKSTLAAVRIRTDFITERLTIVTGSPLDRSQCFIHSLLDMGTMGGIKMASYLSDAVAAIAIDTLGADL